MVAFDFAMRLGEREMLETKAVVSYQRMIFERRRVVLRRVGVDGGTIVLGALDKNGYDRRRDFPAAALNDAVEKRAIAFPRAKLLSRSRGDSWLSRADIPEIIPVRPSRRYPAGLFLIKILGERAPDFRDRTLHVGPADHYGKIAHVGRVLLLEVNMQTLFGHHAGGKSRPRPMVFPLHHPEQRAVEAIESHPLLLENFLHLFDHFPWLRDGLLGDRFDGFSRARVGFQLFLLHVVEENGVLHRLHEGLAQSLPAGRTPGAR